MNYRKLNINEPLLVLDKKVCIRNIERMAEKAVKCGIELRPHFKTHQSHTVGKWFRDSGIKKITVSSLRMAEYFAEDGWDDITVAFPVNPLQSSFINSLSENIKLNLLVSSVNVIPLVNNIKNKVYFYIEIDTGAHRTGMEMNDEEGINIVIDEMRYKDFIEFEGFLTHAGHSYNANSTEQILDVHNKSSEIMRTIRRKYQLLNPAIRISVGDTPTASIADEFDGISEVRPGNFVFYDWMQYKIGSCKNEDISLIAACPVVAVYHKKNEAVIHGGAVHLSKDNINGEDGLKNYGIGVYLTENGWRLPENEIFIKKMSQEHGVLHIPDGEKKYIKEGKVIGIIPIHSCLAADCMGSYMTGDGEVIRMMGK